ncbi:MAG: hypothetical protein AB1756_03935 [Acidobacteriota bacterium]
MKNELKRYNSHARNAVEILVPLTDSLHLVTGHQEKHHQHHLLLFLFLLFLCLLRNFDRSLAPNCQTIFSISFIIAVFSCFDRRQSAQDELRAEEGFHNRLIRRRGIDPSSR